MGVQSPVRREEDLRLLRGKGRYVDDVREPNQAHAMCCARRTRMPASWTSMFGGRG